VEGTGTGNRACSDLDTVYLGQTKATTIIFNLLSDISNLIHEHQPSSSLPSIPAHSSLKWRPTSADIDKITTSPTRC
ncbi:hypothetical protein SERLADRAFT_476206, partial [Serpula lacrymans var. lacrymans S7.9]